MFPDMEGVRVRLDAIEEAQKRSRAAVLVMTVVSLMMIISSYNAYCSLIHAVAVDLGKKGESIRSLDGAVPDRLKARILDEWTVSRMASISLLGIRVDIDDAPQLGSAALFIISIWVVLSLRRENHTIGFLLRDTNAGKSVPDGMDPGQVRRMIFHGIISYSLFTSINKSLKGVSSLGGANPTRNHGKANNVFFSFITAVVFSLPMVTLLFVAATELHSYTSPSPFRAGAAAPFEDFAAVLEEVRKFSGQGTHILASWLCFCTFFVLTSITSFHSHRLLRSTEKVLTEYYAMLQMPENQ